MKREMLTSYCLGRAWRAAESAAKFRLSGNRMMAVIQSEAVREFGFLGNYCAFSEDSTEDLNELVADAERYMARLIEQKKRGKITKEWLDSAEAGGGCVYFRETHEADRKTMAEFAPQTESSAGAL